MGSSPVTMKKDEVSVYQFIISVFCYFVTVFLFITRDDDDFFDNECNDDKRFII